MESRKDAAWDLAGDIAPDAEARVQEALAKEPDVTPDLVAAYLRQNPAFLQQNPGLLDAMDAPDRGTGDGVVDLQTAMLSRRQGEIEDLKDCARTVIETSRTNMSVQSRTHAAVLGLLAAEDFDHLLHVITDELPMVLDVDVCTLGFELLGPPTPMLVSSNVRLLPPGTVDALIDTARTTRLIAEIVDDGTLFGAGSGVVRSAALTRIDPGDDVPVGLLCIGSRDDLFYPGQGTELLTFLTHVVEHCVHRWMVQQPS